jgi:uncharacterized membrane protein YeiB
MSEQKAITVEPEPVISPTPPQERIEVLDILLAAVGRMALSNYLFQSFICTTLFYSYGLGLYGKVGPALGMSLTLVVFLIQIILSVWWLHRFQIGPMEWVAITDVLQIPTEVSSLNRPHHLSHNMNRYTSLT